MLRWPALNDVIRWPLPSMVTFFRIAMSLLTIDRVIVRVPRLILSLLPLPAGQVSMATRLLSAVTASRNVQDPSWLVLSAELVTLMVVAPAAAAVSRVRANAAVM